MKSKVLIAVGVLVLMVSSAWAEMDYTGHKYGVQSDVGFAITKGIDLEGLMKDVLGNTKIEGSSGLVMRFGATGKINLMKGLYLQPTFALSFFKVSLDLKSAQLQYDNNALEKVETSVTDISFGVIPAWYFRFKDMKIHPYAGLGIKMHFVSMGDPDWTWQGGGGTIQGYEGDSKTGFGIAPTAGAEYLLGDNQSISLTLQLDMNFAEYCSDAFVISTGYCYYF